MLEVQQVSYSVSEKLLVKKASMQILPGEFVVIMGANGAGKSTLLKMMSGALLPTEGKILFNGIEPRKYKIEELAKYRAVLSQHYHISFPIQAYEIVLMGRYPYFDNKPTKTDESIVNLAMETMQVSHLSSRDYNTLSSGEAQKVQMSRVLSQIGETTLQQTKLLLLDEPVSHLDIKYQHQLLKEAKLLCLKNVGVVAVLHDINLALKYADKILFMKDGEILQSIAKQEPVTAQLLMQVFDIEVKIFDMPDGSGKFVSF